MAALLGGQVSVMGTDTRKVLDFLEFVSGNTRVHTAPESTLQVLQREGVVEYQDDVGQFQIVRLFEV